jgi:DNA-binding transcriptional MerR regulator
MKNDVLLTGDVAREAEVTPATVRWWETTGQLRARKTVSGRRLFAREDVDAFIAKRRAAAASRAQEVR